MKRRSHLTIGQQNILAPLWLNDSYRLLPCYSDYTRPDRILTTLAYLQQWQADIYCCCEVQEDLLGAIAEHFPDHQLIYSSNCQGYWKEWLDEGEAWESNGTAIILRKDLPVLSMGALDLGDGCRATLVKLEVNGRHVYVVSAHFDTSVLTRSREIATLLDLLSDVLKSQALVIISGDFNTDGVEAFTSRGFISGLPKDLSRHTTPLPSGEIDHTLVSPGLGGLKSLSSYLDVIQGNGEEDLSLALGNPEVLEAMKSKGVSVEQAKVIGGSLCRAVQTNGSDHYGTVTRLEF